MIWSVMIFTMMVTAGTRWWSQWGFRVTVISSLAANLVLGLLSSTRRRSASGRCASKFHLFLVFILWLAYLIAEAAATSAIGNLSLCGSDVTDDEKHLVAFWAPFLLLHRGGPDNLSAYALEDNKFSLRTSFGMITHISAVIYAIYNSYRGGGSGVLIAASVIVLVSGAVRYGERVYALWKANLDSMKEDVPSSSSSSSSSSDKEKTQRKESSWEQDKMDGLRSSIIEKRMMAEQRKKQVIGDDGEALLLAQDLSPVWRHAIVDSSVEPGSIRQLASEEIIRSLDWESMCRVVEMELSLVYELLYTKAIVAHTWQGYLIRFVSPLAIAAAAWLFWLRGHGGGGGTTARGSLVGISYALLAIAFVQDVAWLLRALGSTWTYDYLQKEQTRAWLRHHALHAGKARWYSLHRSLLRLDPLRLFCVDPVSYRRWSGTIGQYNLLHECTTTTRGQQCPPGWLASLAGGSVKEIQYLSKLPKRTKELLFERVKKILLEAIEHKDDDSNNKAATPDKNKVYADKHYIMVNIRTLWGQKAFHLTRNRKVLFEDEAEAPRFGKEFEEDVLCWHIATCIVLPFIRYQVGIPSSSKSRDHADAIAVMSEYMMFLVAVRREMLPGLVLHSQFEVTQKALVRLWNKFGGAEDILREKDKAAARDDKEKLAMILRRLRADQVDEDIKHEWDKIQGDEGTRLLVDAVELYRSLKLAGDTPANRHRRKQGKKVPKRDRRPPPAEELLEFIFNVWVDKLVYASVRCSRETHAKQLSAGGDLTTVLWMVIQHAGPFRMGEPKPIYFKHHKTSADPPRRPQAPPKADPLPPPPPALLPSPSPPPALAPYPPYYHPVCPWPPPSWAPQCPPQYEKPGDEPPTAPAPPAPEEAIEDEDEDEEDSDEEYNLPIEYVTLY